MIRTGDRGNAHEQGYADILAILANFPFDLGSDNVGDAVYDTLYSIGPWKLFIFYKGNAVAGFTDATNAVYTVPTGRTLVVLDFGGAELQDTANRTARFRNTTDLVDVVSTANFQNAYINFSARIGFYTGDVATPSSFAAQVAAGKTVKLGLSNFDTTKRAMGAWVIAREY